VSADDTKPAAKGSDLVKVYVVLFALFSGGLGYFFLKASTDRAAYAEARADAERLLSKAPGGRREGTPTTLYDVGVDILRYLETYQSAQLKSGEAVPIPLKEIQDRLDGMQLTLRTSTTVTEQKNASRKYTELSSTFSLQDVPNLENFAKFLYNLEGASTSLRVLELTWALDARALQNYPPGNAITGATFRLGVRRPLTTDAR
jgi:hypothetical protein